MVKPVRGQIISGKRRECFIISSFLKSSFSKKKFQLPKCTLIFRQINVNVAHRQTQHLRNYNTHETANFFS